ncbi:polysaccharide deacetylase family protein [Peteryoungia desertarenae]|uniref:Polysaccharide deacetylase family protein n=1 Tax=Peteryoungia desertarenae TaxID=1813451 RepID=A0ABX6QI70_9HYPH|nr:polysaccharide deacetylase family protein [Peteryoungia desertarenae]QLF68271.1 polysaccharide deacetylase family protein [Peteryoungia desertarenae]
MLRSVLTACMLFPLLDTIAKAETTQTIDDKRGKQLVLISFDGALDNRLWERSRNFAKAHGIHFTYFLSCTTLIPRERAGDYKAPGMKAGRSNIGFAASPEDVSLRLRHIWEAHTEGHEIASHTCGHFDGKEWTKAEWLTEFETFHRVLANVWKDNGEANQEPEGWADFVSNGIIGFRAPYLSAPESLHAAQREFGYRYDASLVSHDPERPRTVKGVTRFALPLIPEGPRQRRIIAMDYNLFIRHSAGLNNPSRAAEFEESAYQAFRAAFESEYRGARAPLQIGLHFVEMNDGAYWRAMERLASDVCGLPDVACVTYRQALDMLEGEGDQAATPGAM